MVWAYRRQNEHYQIVENCSDDGEPKGTSGPPVLNVMRGEELVECAILIVRYFGGIKLGTGGLVRAYKDAALAAVAAAELTPFENQKELAFFIPYSDISKVEYLMARFGLEFARRDFGPEGLECSVRVGQSDFEAFEKQLTPLARNIAARDIK